MNRSFIKFLICTSFIIATNNIFTATATITINRASKNDLSPDLLAQAQKSKMSILTPTKANLPILYQNYPKGSVLFPNNSDLATKFDIVINAIQKNPSLIEFIRKIHIDSLNQLYMYLMTIYTNLNLYNPGSSPDPTKPTATNLSDYLTSEAMYATNKKKMLMNHFINLVQAQFSASIISYAPTTPPDMAAMLGKVFIHNDCGIDLKPYSIPQTNAKIIASQAPFFTALQQYIDFFKTYTNYLSQIDVNGVNQFYNLASTIATACTTKSSAIAQMNPTMFFYDVDSLRSIQFIPFVASTIPADSQLIPWAPTVLDAVAKRKTVNGHVVAYFADADGSVTYDQTKAVHLYLYSALNSIMFFEQELLAQPAWLNNKEGAIRILRSCLGDFSALVGLGILDGKTEMVIQNALKGMSSSTSPAKQ